MSTGADHGPGVRVPPPVMVGGTIILAWALIRLVPVPLGPPAVALGNAVLCLARIPRRLEPA